MRIASWIVTTMITILANTSILSFAKFWKPHFQESSIGFNWSAQTTAFKQFRKNQKKKSLGPVLFSWSLVNFSERSFTLTLFPLSVCVHCECRFQIKSDWYSSRIYDEQVRISIHMRRIWIICFLSNVFGYKLSYGKAEERARKREREKWMLVEVSTLARRYHRIDVRVNVSARERRICVFFSIMIVCYFWSNHKQPVELNLRQPLGKNVNFHSSHFVIRTYVCVFVWTCMRVKEGFRKKKNLQPVGACLCVCARAM